MSEFTEEQVIEMMAEAAETAKTDRLNTYSVEILDAVDLPQDELNCGHEYMIQQLETTVSVLKEKIDDITGAELSAYISLGDEVASQKIKINELVILLNKLSERIKVLEKQ